jgi:hypothetical protein
MSKPIFERRHYEKLAAWWKEQGIQAKNELERNYLIYGELFYERMITMLKQDNPNFDEHLFDLASGYDRIS